MIGFVFLFCFLDEGWVMPGLVFKWFPLCEFSLFDTEKGTPQVSWEELGAGGEGDDRG